MEYFTTDIWKAIQNVMALCLCFTIILYLIKNKIKENPEITNKIKNGIGLKGCVDKEEDKNRENPYLSDESICVLKYFSSTQKNIEQNNDLDDEPYNEVIRLAGLGMSVKEIYEKVRISVSEIELILKYKGLGLSSFGKS